MLFQELAEARKKKRKPHYTLEQVCTFFNKNCTYGAGSFRNRKYFRYPKITYFVSIHHEHYIKLFIMNTRKSVPKIFKVPK